MEAIVCIQIKKNNIFFSLTDKTGKVKAWKSTGCAGFRNARKSTPYAAYKLANDFVKTVKSHKVEMLHVKVWGFGPGREPAIRNLFQSDLQILTFMDKTPRIHNGCRPPKIRKL